MSPTEAIMRVLQHLHITSSCDPDGMEKSNVVT